MAVEAKRGEIRFAEQNVRRVGLKAYLPLVKSESGKRIVSMFDDYFFVGWTPEWGRVNHVRGVRNVVLTCGVPGIIDSRFIKELQARENKRGVIDLDSVDAPPPVRGRIYEDGARVRPSCGSWLNQLGIVSGAGRDHLVRVLFSLLGKPVLVEFDEDDLRADVLAAV